MTTIRRLLVLSLLLAGCATSPLPAGAQCAATSECDTNLQCLEFAQFSGTTCTVVGKSCSTTCIDDTSCAALGANFKCFATCGTEKACAMVATP